VSGESRYGYAREEDVAGVVSSVFVDIRARLPFVPAVFIVFVPAASNAG
jgi:hypothetical protein